MGGKAVSIKEDPGIGKRVKGALYETEGGDARKWNGHQFLQAGPLLQSEHAGVLWHAQAGKWRGEVRDTTERAPNGRAKLRTTKLFDDEDACVAAVKVLRAEVKTRKAQTLHALAQKLDHTRDLPLRPDEASDAKAGVAYYGEKAKKAHGETTKDFRPNRFMRKGNGKGEFELVPCCRHGIGAEEACTQQAKPSVAKGEALFCKTHGGGLTFSSGPNFCSLCNAQEIAPIRQVSKGGNGLCTTCEEHRNAEARANGSKAPPPKNQRWEDFFFEKLLPQITYADGAAFPPDQRDQRKGGGLGDPESKKRRRECDTTTNRFPDCMHVRRDEDGRAMLVVVTECDEHSHGDRDPLCESGKVDDEFQSVQTVLNNEGAARHARTGRADARMVPIVFFKVNPNAYDGHRTNLKFRINRTAYLVNSYLQKSEAEIDALQTDAPIVHVLYYHSKKGAKNLAHFAAKAPLAKWEYTCW